MRKRIRIKRLTLVDLLKENHLKQSLLTEISRNKKPKEIRDNNSSNKNRVNSYTVFYIGDYRIY